MILSRFDEITKDVHSVFVSLMRRISIVSQQKKISRRRGAPGDIGPSLITSQVVVVPLEIRRIEAVSATCGNRRVGCTRSWQRGVSQRRLGQSDARNARPPLFPAPRHPSRPGGLKICNGHRNRRILVSGLSRRVSL